MNPEDPTNPEVQHVVAVRAEEQSSQLEHADAQRPMPALTSGASAFFTTLKRLVLLALILALGAAWWAEEGSVWRGVGTALLVFIPLTVVALLQAGQRAAVAVAVQMSRQMGIARGLVNLVLNEVAAGPAATPGINVALPASATGRLPIGEACNRLKASIADWKGNTVTGSALVRRSQQWLGTLIEKILFAKFQEFVGQGGVDLEQVRLEMATRIDDDITDRVYNRTAIATIGAVIAMIAWAVLVGYSLHRLAQV